MNRLFKINPNLMFVQFVDGDCEIVDSCLNLAQQQLEQQEQVAVVFGRRRGGYFDQSIHNSLCDMEWNTPVGEAESCGGDSMMRVKAFQQVEHFNFSMIAGEESALCLRLRQRG